MNKYILEIELGGNQYTLQYTMGLPRLLDEHFSIDLISVDPDKLQEQVGSGSKLIRFIQGVVWSGIANHANQSKQGHPLKIEEVLDLMDGLLPDEAAALSVKVLTWIFTCLGIPADITNEAPAREDGKQGDRFHVEKDKAVRPRRNGSKAR